MAQPQQSGFLSFVTLDSQVAFFLEDADSSSVEVPITAHQQLVEFRVNGIKPQRTKRTNINRTVLQDNDQKLRLLDRLTRWMVFMYCSNFQWLDILHQVYSPALSADSFEYLTGRSKIFDSAKAFKSRTIHNMEVNLIHCTSMCRRFVLIYLVNYRSTLVF